MTRPKVYIAGPMTGHPEFNFPAFYAAEDALTSLGYETVNPARLDDESGTPKDQPSEYYMKRDLPAMLTCDAIMLIEGWRDSKGALKEIIVGMVAGLDVYLLVPVGAGEWEVYPANLKIENVMARLIGLDLNVSEGAAWPEEQFAWMTEPRQGWPRTWDEALDMVLRQMRDIMIERQAKYGPLNIAQQGLYGVITRAAADKVQRVKRALNGRIVEGEVVLDYISDGTEENDTFEDGLLDAANYLGPIATMLHRGWWGLPRKGDAK